MLSAASTPCVCSGVPAPPASNELHACFRVSASDLVVLPKVGTPAPPLVPAEILHDTSGESSAAAHIAPSVQAFYQIGIRGIVGKFHRGLQLVGCQLPALILLHDPSKWCQSCGDLRRRHTSGRSLRETLVQGLSQDCRSSCWRQGWKQHFVAKVH